MPNVGTFTKPEDGFVGTMRTLAFNVKVKIVPVAKDNDKGPDYRVIAGAMEIGAAWIPQATRGCRTAWTGTGSNFLPVRCYRR